MRIRIAAVAGCAALAVAGCGAASASAGAPARLATSARPPESPQQVAEADVTRMLAAFRPPPGAKRSGPVGLPALSGLLDTMGGPDVIMRTVWWRAPGTTPQVLAWLRAHRPTGLAHPLGGSAGLGSDIAEEVSYSVPPDPAVIWDGYLNIWVEADGTHGVAIRVDSEVAWFPAKPASERIPTAARVVTITALPATYSPSVRQAGKSPAPVTVTDPATVTRIAGVVDGLPRMPPGPLSCPAGGRLGLRLTFRAVAGGPVLAQVTYDGNGCGTVAVVIGGKQLPTLWDAWQMEPQVLKLAGLHWPTVVACGLFGCSLAGAAGPGAASGRQAMCSHVRKGPSGKKGARSGAFPNMKHFSDTGGRHGTGDVPDKPGETTTLSGHPPGRAGGDRLGATGSLPRPVVREVQ